MIAICEYFGGSEDLRRAKQLEELLEEAGKEIPEDFIRNCLEIASRKLGCDYLGQLYGLVAQCIADDLRDEIGTLYINEIDTECYPNYISSSAQITVYFADDIDEIIDGDLRDYERIIGALEKIKSRYSRILDTIFIDLTFVFKDKEYSFEEMIDYFKKLVGEKSNEEENL